MSVPDEPEEKPQDTPADQAPEVTEEVVAEAAQRPEDTSGAAPEQDSTKEGAGSEQEGEAKEDAVSQLAELWKEDPEAAKAFAETLPQEIKDSFRGEEIDVLRTAQESRQRKRQTEVAEIQARAVKADETRKGATDTWLQELETTVGRGVDDLVDGRTTSKAVLGDTKKLSDKVAEFTVQAQAALYDRMVGVFGLQLHAVLENHATASHLTSDQREKIAQLGSNPGGDGMYPWIADLLHVYLDAAQASAPKEAETRIRKELDSDLERKERLAKAMKVIGGNGRKRKALPGGSAPGGSGKRYVDMTAEERGKLTPQQRDEVIAEDRARTAAVSV